MKYPLFTYQHVADGTERVKALTEGVTHIIGHVDNVPQSSKFEALLINTSNLRSGFVTRQDAAKWLWKEYNK